MNEQIRELLLIDDNDDHAELAEYCIREYVEDIIVRHLHDGKEAIEFINDIEERRKSSPWLVLLDLKMPKYNGFEVLSRLKSSPVLSKTPVVIFSTSNSPQDIEKALEKNANSYIVKPIKADMYFDTINKILDYWKISQRYADPIKNKFDGK